MYCSELSLVCYCCNLACASQHTIIVIVVGSFTMKLDVLQCNFVQVTLK